MGDSSYFFYFYYYFFIIIIIVISYSSLKIAVMFQVMSVLPFSAKNAFVTAYLLESSLARLKNVLCCFQTISCLLSFKEGNQWISSAACLFSPL